MSLPIGQEAGIEGVVDLITGTAYRYPGDGSGKRQKIDIPPMMKEEVEAARKVLIERFEASLMMLVFGDPEVELGDLRKRLAHRLLRLPGAQARVAAVGFAVARALCQLLAQRGSQG